MTNRTIVYGNIVDDRRRRKLSESAAPNEECLVWFERPAMFEGANDTPIVFVDLDDPKFANSEFLLSIATAGRKVRVIGKIDEPSADDALRFSKLGVSEILTGDQCLQRLETLLNEAEKIPVRSEEHVPTKFGVQALIGCSPQIQEIRRTIKLLSDVDFPSALVLGDTGTGKSLISKILHNSGVRARHNLVEVNCSAIPDELFESELFGHARGAFTDAKSEKAGLFEYAEGGTLFLDEVGNLSASAQAKLLKILEDKRLRKVGAINEKDINVRVVTATNLDLHEAIKAGRFREDLYFRLNLLTLEIPPLRERPSDIPELVEHYLAYYATNYGKVGLAIEPEATEHMQEYEWPGNVRELCNVIERAVLLTKTETIRADDIRKALSKARISAAERQQIVIEIPPQGLTLQQIEQSAVKQVLNMCDWNKTEAAKFLGISRPRLRRIIESSGLEQNRRKR